VAATSAPAWADQIGDAAKKLSEEAYPFMKEVNWNSYVPLARPGSASSADWLKAIDKAIVMGAQMDPDLLKKGVQAHHKACGSIKEGNLVLSKADFEAVNAAIGRMIASVPESTTMDLYKTFSSLVPDEVPKYLMSTVNEADAKRAYSALMQFKDVVKANPITPNTPATPAALSSKFPAIDAAASKLADASYPFIKEVAWDSKLSLTPLPGQSPAAVLKAIDKALVMGASMDGKVLQDAAMAHHNAIGSVDANLVTSKEGYQATLAGIGKLIASVPASQTMDVFNAFSKITNPAVPNYLFSSVNGADAAAAYDSFLAFKDVVKAAQR